MFKIKNSKFKIETCSLWEGVKCGFEIKEQFINNEMDRSNFIMF